MLGQRIVTALVMLAVLLAALWPASPLPFTLLALLLMAAAAWEWARLNGVAGTAALGAALAMLVACGLSVWLGGLADGLWPGLTSGPLQAGASALPSGTMSGAMSGAVPGAASGALARLPGGGWWLAVLGWGLGGGWLLAGGVPGWQRWAKPLRLVAGLAALWAAWLAVVQSRMVGVNYLVSVLALVAAADMAAYFAGRAFGGRLVARKLAAAISPNKSWEGVFGGMAGVLLLAGLWIAFDRHLAPAAWSRSLYSQLLDGGGALVLGVALLALTAFSVVGDLVESLVKRAAGVKDSSRLLPGHGGVLDRIDAQLPTLPFALALLGAVAPRMAGA